MNRGANTESLIKDCFCDNPFCVDKSSSPQLYVYDDNCARKTFMVDVHTDKAFCIENNKSYDVYHVCVDGGIVEHGKEDYVGDGIERGRCDCLVFNDNELLFVEMKMDTLECTQDRTKWGNFAKGMKQISDFFVYFIKQVEDKKAIKFGEHYQPSEMKAVICMEFLPSFDIRINAQRHNQLERFRTETGIKLIHGTSYSFH